MTQQAPYQDEDYVYKKRLFYDNGIKYVECQGKIINDYTPPTPVLKSSVNTVLQASSGLVQGGTGHYTVKLTLLFYSKKELADWLQYIGSYHKYYDEKGTVYIGICDSEPNIETMEMETKYKVALSLTMIRKQEFEQRHQNRFIDITGHWAEEYIDDLQERGLIAVFSYDGNPVQYFRPEDQLTRAEATSFIVRMHRQIERLLRGY